MGTVFRAAIPDFCLVNPAFQPRHSRESGNPEVGGHRWDDRDMSTRPGEHGWRLRVFVRGCLIIAGVSPATPETRKTIVKQSGRLAMSPPSADLLGFASHANSPFSDLSNTLSESGLTGLARFSGFRFAQLPLLAITVNHARRIWMSAWNPENPIIP